MVLRELGKKLTVRLSLTETQKAQRLVANGYLPSISNLWHRFFSNSWAGPPFYEVWELDETIYPSARNLKKRVTHLLLMPPKSGLHKVSSRAPGPLPYANPARFHPAATQTEGSPSNR